MRDTDAVGSPFHQQCGPYKVNNMEQKTLQSRPVRDVELFSDICMILYRAWVTEIIVSPPYTLMRKH